MFLNRVIIQNFWQCSCNQEITFQLITEKSLFTQKQPIEMMMLWKVKVKFTLVLGIKGTLRIKKYGKIKQIYIRNMLKIILEIHYINMVIES